MNQIGIDSHHVVTTFLSVFDLTGTFIFALSGAIAAVKHRLDAFGVLVLCLVTGNAGGITRDIMIGALPPAAINEWRYAAVSILAGLVVFFGYPLMNRLSSPVLLFDAAGLGLFCVAGADKALAFHAGPLAATLLGMTTGIGGGMVRDVLVMEIPTVLRTELYAVAALLGAAFAVGGQRLGMPAHVAAPVGAALCIGLRLLALRYGWHLPVARVKALSTAEGEDQVGGARSHR
ncbi:MAG: trimeric intracellular cation channel family protein [Acidobacteria bacterium]|nr:trimeric intracellular cation channel family protein [Acidobacteriota bacterium]